MTPVQAKQQIQAYFDANNNGNPVMRRGVRNMVISFARKAAEHNGVPDQWKTYLPDGFEL